MNQPAHVMPPLAYSGGTASMQVDPEARHAGDAASESFPGESFPGSFTIEAAQCATYPIAMEWVPDHERRVVPDMLSALCRRCPGRQACLLWALAGREHGYWAGTTTADRTRMSESGERSVSGADQMQESAREQALAARDGTPAAHPRGEGSFWWYRHRACRCGECRAANSARRAAERTKTKAHGRAAA